jgi:TatD DNase family protein
MAERGVFFTIGVEVLSSTRIQDSARAVPPEQLLTETDNPDGLQWMTGVLGMPVRIREVVQKLAELRNTTCEDIIRTGQENLARLMRDDPWLFDPYARFFG